MDNPKFVKKYHQPNADGQIPIHCINFSYSEKKDYSETCSVNLTEKNFKLETCEAVNGQFCDCYRPSR